MSGIFGTFGLKTEVAPGTAVVVDTFIPILSAGFQVGDAKIQSQGLRGQNFAGCVKDGPRTITGSFETELFGVGIASMLKHMFGTVVTTGLGPYVHTYTVGSLGALAFTAEEAIPNGAGDKYGVKYAGCKFTEWSLAVAAGELVKVSGSISAQSVVTGAVPAVASYADSCPFSFVDASLTLNGTPVAEAESVSLSVNQALRTDDHKLGSRNIRNQSHNGFKTVTGEFKVEFDDLTLADLYLSGADAALVVTLDNGVESLVITLPTIKLTGSMPELSGPDVVKQTIPFMAYNELGVSASVMSAVLTNTEVTAA